MIMRELMKRLTLTVTVGLTLVSAMHPMASAETATPSVEDTKSTALEFDSNRFRSHLSKFEVRVSDDNFEITDAQLYEYRQGKGEYVFIEGGYSYLEVDFFQDQVTPKKNIQIWEESLKEDYENVVKIDGEATREEAWGLFSYNYEDDDNTIYYFVRIRADVSDNVDVLEAIESTDVDFLDELVSAQEGITVGDEPFLGGVDAEELNEKAEDGGEPTDDQPTQSPKKNEDSTPEPGR